jgi:hypothetical protein
VDEREFAHSTRDGIPGPPQSAHLSALEAAAVQPQMLVDWCLFAGHEGRWEVAELGPKQSRKDELRLLAGHPVVLENALPLEKLHRRRCKLYCTHAIGLCFSQKELA